MVIVGTLRFDAFEHLRGVAGGVQPCQSGFIATPQRVLQALPQQKDPNDGPALRTQCNIGVIRWIKGLGAEFASKFFNASWRLQLPARHLLLRLLFLPMANCVGSLSGSAAR